MRLVTFAAPGRPSTAVGALRPDGRVVDLRAALAGRLVAGGASPPNAASAAEEAIPPAMEPFISGGPPCLAAAASALEAAGDPQLPPDAGAVLEPSEFRLLAPLARPNSIRDFAGFEDHARAGARRRGAELPAAWRDRPFYYRGNHRAVVGPDEPVARPSFTRELDFELEVACVVGREVRDAAPQEAGDAIFGFTVMNDWSARDVQRAEMESRMGPSKSKDFATSLGPAILVADPGSPHPPLALAARVNGRTVGEWELGAAFWTFPDMIAFVSRGETVWPTDVYGSGTPFGGCMLDRGGPWLEPGDLVELEAEGIGVLRNRVV